MWYCCDEYGLGCLPLSHAAADSAGQSSKQMTEQQHILSKTSHTLTAPKTINHSRQQTRITVQANEGKLAHLTHTPCSSILTKTSFCWYVPLAAGKMWSA